MAMELNYAEAQRIANEECWDDPRSAPHAMQVVHLVGRLDFEIANGGVLQWLTNQSGRYTVETIAALDEIGAADCANIVRKIVDFFPGGKLPEDEVERATLVEELCPVAYPAWCELGDSYLQPGPDDVDWLLGRYVELHALEFRRTSP
jgi:hypothetical protein